MSHKARRITRLRKNRPVAAKAEREYEEKDVYGAEARVETAHRPYRFFEGVDGHRPIIMGFQRNEVNGV